MKLDVYSLQNEKVGEVEVDEAVFDAPLAEHLHHKVVVAQMAARRSGTACTKTRGQVGGTTAKMYRQKGTGRARHHAKTAPIFAGGGVAFGPKPRSYEKKVNKKVRQAALRSVVSNKIRNGQLKVVEEFPLAEIKTKDALNVLEKLETNKALVVDDNDNRNLKLSVRNLKDYKFLASEGLNVLDALRFDQLIVTRPALQKIEGRLKP